jgi:hypothetical protein
MRHLPRLLAISAALLCGMAMAQQNPPSKPAEGQSNGQEPAHRGPPPESLAACKSLTSGAACQFTSPRGAETGTCGAPEGKPLACRPARGPGQDKGPPGQDGEKKPPKSAK